MCIKVTHRDTCPARTSAVYEQRGPVGLPTRNAAFSARQINSAHTDSTHSTQGTKKSNSRQDINYTFQYNKNCNAISVHFTFKAQFLNHHI